MRRILQTAALLACAILPLTAQPQAGMNEAREPAWRTNWHEIQNRAAQSPWDPSTSADRSLKSVPFRKAKEHLARTDPALRHRVPGRETHLLSPGVDTAWVRTYASGLASAENTATDAAVDGDGNIYVTGSSATVKYDTYGNLRWAAKCKDDRYGSFYPYEIAVEDSGGVFVGGVGLPWGKPAIIVVKYGLDGDVKWSIEITDAYASDVGPVPSLLIEPDGKGNVFLATSHFDPAGQGTWSGVLQKYDAGGALQWTAPIDLYYASDLECDELGNVFIVSTKGNTSEGLEWLLATYASDGQEIWSTRDSLGVYAIALALDEEGNTYVTGSSTNEVYIYIPGTSLTAKYDSAGSRQWFRTYSDLDSAGLTLRVPRWIGIDTPGNILVAGVTDQGTVILKHDSSGREQWVERLDNFWLSGTTLDNDGNVIAAISPWYCCGSNSLRKYDLNGTVAWTRELTGIDCSALLVDAGGNILLVGGPGGYLTVKLDRNGLERWRRTYREVGFSEDRANALAVDACGNCYVGGSSNCADSWNDFLTIKYDPDGTEQWFARYTGHGSTFEWMSDISSDVSGNVYVTGNSDTCLATVKYSKDGSMLWEQRSSELRYWSHARILVDPAGNSYVMGSGWTAPGNWSDIALLSYTADGQERWVRGYDLTGVAYAEGFAMDPRGNLYIGARTTDSTQEQNFVVMMVDSLGETKWSATYGPLQTNDNRLAGVGVDHHGNTFIAGYNEEKCLLAKYNSSGAVQWAVHSPVRARPAAICVDPDGNSYLTGWTWGLYATDAMTMCYDSSGQLLWLHQFGDDVHNENGLLLAVDSAGSAYVVGHVEKTLDPYLPGILTLKYTRNGQIGWEARYHGPAGGWAHPCDVAVSSHGEVFVTGYSEGPWPDVASCMMTIKYVQLVTSVAPREIGIPAMFVLHQNYPNPFNPATTIRYELPKASRVKLTVYNILGEEVATLVNAQEPGGGHTVQFDASGLPSGVYLYRLRTDDFVATKQLVLLR